MIKTIVPFLCILWVISFLVCSAEKEDHAQKTPLAEDMPEAVSRMREKPAGSFPAGASPYGLMDMAGNVWEWCYDVYEDDYYSASPYKNPLGPPGTGTPDQDRVNRGGGSWTDRSGHITPEGGHNLRSAARTGDEQNSSDDHMGFRLCIDPLNR